MIGFGTEMMLLCFFFLSFFLLLKQCGIEFELMLCVFIITGIL